MIKIFSVFCSLMILVPYAVSAAAYYDPRDSEISRLTAEKQRKYAELEKCAKSVKGLQIAGISTIGLTAGGVALNISQANKSKTLDKQIDSTNSKIEKKKQEIEEKRIKEEQERAERERQAQAKTICEADGTKQYLNGTCIDKTSSQTQQTTAATTTESQTASQTTQIEPQSTQAKADNTVDTNQEMESENSCKALASMKHGTECYQDSAGKWKVRWTVKEGDSCPISECFDQTNTATCKYVWVPSSFVCVADTCKTGYKVFGHMCQKENPITCDETKGEIVAMSGDECIKCVAGRIAKNGHCEECPSDKKPAGNKCIDYTCGPSEFKTWGECTKCPQGRIVKNNHCVECPVTQKAENNQCVDYTCGPSEFKTWGDCTKCQKNYIVENNHCVECPSTKKAENNRCVDFTCPSNMLKSFGECVACNTLFENMVPNADQSGCEPNKTTNVLDAFKQACSEIGGRLENQTKCVLTGGTFEDRNKKCGTMDRKVNLPVYIGSDDGGITNYCSI